MVDTGEEDKSWTNNLKNGQDIIFPHLCAMLPSESGGELWYPWLPSKHP